MVFVGRLFEGAKAFRRVGRDSTMASLDHCSLLHFRSGYRKPPEMGKAGSSRHAEPSPEALNARASAGDSDAAEELFVLLYCELRRLARAYVRKERRSHALSATSLVHEAYMRLVPPGGLEWSDRSHFLAIAGRAMRQVLVERSRARSTQKRGGGARPITLVDVTDDAAHNAVDPVVLDQAMTRLAEHDSRLAELVEMRFFGGLTLEEAAETMGASTASVKRWWKFARTWLARELRT
jgi:RNA polymerase sigma factor (TIGR02999 family)